MRSASCKEHRLVVAFQLSISYGEHPRDLFLSPQAVLNQDNLYSIIQQGIKNAQTVPHFITRCALLHLSYS